MRYRVRTPEGELGYPSQEDLVRAYSQGLVGPEDEVLEQGHTTWRKAASLPVLVRAQPKPSGLAGRAQLGRERVTTGSPGRVGSGRTGRRPAGRVRRQRQAADQTRPRSTCTRRTSRGRAARRVGAARTVNPYHVDRV